MRQKRLKNLREVDTNQQQFISLYWKQHHNCYSDLCKQSARGIKLLAGAKLEQGGCCATRDPAPTVLLWSLLGLFCCSQGEHFPSLSRAKQFSVGEFDFNLLPVKVVYESVIKSLGNMEGKQWNKDGGSPSPLPTAHLVLATGCIHPVLAGPLDGAAQEVGSVHDGFLLPLQLSFSFFSPAPFSSCISSALALVLHRPSPLGLSLPQHVSPQPQSPQRPLFLFYLIYLNIFIPSVIIKTSMDSSGTCLCSAKPRLGLVGWSYGIWGSPQLLPWGLLERNIDCPLLLCELRRGWRKEEDQKSQDSWCIWHWVRRSPLEGVPGPAWITRPVRGRQIKTECLIVTATVFYHG